jgi:replication-associated recombination protein RarA
MSLVQKQTGSMRLEAYLHYILRLFQIPQGVLPVGRRWPNLQIEDQGHARLRLSGIWSIP